MPFDPEIAGKLLKLILYTQLSNFTCCRQSHLHTQLRINGQRYHFFFTSQTRFGCYLNEEWRKNSFCGTGPYSTALQVRQLSGFSQDSQNHLGHFLHRTDSYTKGGRTSKSHGKEQVTESTGSPALEEVFVINSHIFRTSQILKVRSWL